MKERCCGNCRFWDKEGEYGFCACPPPDIKIDIPVAYQIDLFATFANHGENCNFWEGVKDEA